MREPNRFEWLDQERERVAREGTGARYVSHVYSQHLKRTRGMALGMLPALVALMAFPTAPDGSVPRLSTLLAGTIMVAISIGILRLLKPSGLVAVWAMWTNLGMGVVFSVASLLT